MNRFINKKGMSAIVVVLIIAGFLIVLFNSLGNVFNSLNKTSNNLRDYSENLNVSLDMGQMINNAYNKAQATSSVLPPTCDSQSTAVSAGSFYLCLPNSTFCSQFNSMYCLANPYVVAEHKEGEAGPQEFIVLKQARGKKLIQFAKAFLFLLQPALAQSTPETWLPDVSGSTLELTIATPSCATTTGTDINCIRCEGASKNAHCVKVRFCKNATSTCLTEEQWIEPTFAIQINYGP